MSQATFSGKVTRILTEDEREAFAVFISQNQGPVRLFGCSGFAVREAYEKYAGPEKEVGRAAVPGLFITTASIMARPGY
jgi:hypothetical protein